MPFSMPPDDASPPQPELRQLDVRSFRLLTTFHYRDPSAGNQLYVVPSQGGGGETTDLASVPSLLWGLIAPYGHQTLPALLHDKLCDDAATAKNNGDNDAAWAIRHNANRLFLISLGEQGVPWTRRWMMWAAVELSGMFGYAKGRAFAVAGLLVAGLLCTVRVEWALGAWPWARSLPSGTLTWLAFLVPALCGFVKPEWFAVAAIGSYAALPVLTVLVVVFAVSGLIWFVPSGAWWILRKLLPGVDAGQGPVFGPTALRQPARGMD